MEANMSIFSTFLSEWEKFYIKVCQAALDSEDSFTDEQHQGLKLDYYSLYSAVSDFGLSETELSAFMLIALSQSSSVVADMIEKLQKARQARHRLPDYGLITTLNPMFLDTLDFRPGLLIREDNVLNTYLVMNAHGETSDITLDMPLSLRPGILSWILGEEYALGDAASVVELHHPDSTEDVIAHDEELEKLIAIYSNMNAIHEKGLIHLKGDFGTGKCFMVRCLSKVSDYPLVIVDVKKLLSFEMTTMDMMINRIIQKCFLDNAILYLDFGEEEKYVDVHVQRLISVVQRFWGVVIAGSCGSIFRELSLTGNLHVLEINNPNKFEQKRYWNYFADNMQIKFADDIDLDKLVSTFDLAPGRIRRSLACARDLTMYDGEAFIIDRAILYQEIRKICAGHFSELATKLSTPFGWDELKASEKTKSLMKEAINRVRYKAVVNEQFGFAKKLPYGQGLSVAFYGPPGTGKTMAATVMAKELGMDIYRIDLSQISSKYIGESEKNLSAVFDSAKYSNAILFFDEADALFARRTDVSSSNDKHANSETAFLLQKMEEYSGICILATNVIQNFDAAFKRRITFMIPVDKPSEEERISLWKSVFPEGTPIDKDVNFEGYAKALELSGAEIKSAALRAAYVAASENRAVSHMDIALAIDEEYKKTGHISVLPQLLGASTKGNW